MEELIEAIKQCVNEQSFQLHEVSGKDWDNLEVLKNKNYINIGTVDKEKEIVEVFKGENYHRL